MAEPLARVRFPEPAQREIVEAARRALPAEACGTLLGRRVGDELEILAVRTGRNLAASPSRYDLDPAEIVAAERDALSRGLELVGIWHSHPEGPPRPSEGDREHAWAGWIWLIVSGLSSPAPEIGAWRFDPPEGFVALALVR